jgi:hypothetical protein
MVLVATAVESAVSPLRTTIVGILILIGNVTGVRLVAVVNAMGPGVVGEKTYAVRQPMLNGKQQAVIGAVGAVVHLGDASEVLALYRVLA